jgi:hypothetical protein
MLEIALSTLDFLFFIFILVRVDLQVNGQCHVHREGWSVVSSISH